MLICLELNPVNFTDTGYYGRYQPKKGFRFNSQKLLIDPYAKAICGRVEVNGQHVRL